MIGDRIVPGRGELQEKVTEDVFGDSVRATRGLRNFMCSRYNVPMSGISRGIGECSQSRDRIPDIDREVGIKSLGCRSCSQRFHCTENEKERLFPAL